MRGIGWGIALEFFCGWTGNEVALVYSGAGMGGSEGVTEK